MRGFTHFLVRCGLLAAAFVSGAVAQEVTAGIFGVVQDSTGAVVPGCTLELKNAGTGRLWRASSDESGNFSITLLPIGTYTVTAEAKGFKKMVVSDVVLRVNDNRKLVFSLDVGQTSDQVTVEASAVTVNVATGTTSQLLDGKDMVNMPSRGRNVLPFALLMPGVVSTTPYDRRNNNSAVNGIRPTANAWLIDGGYNIDTGGNWGSPLAPNIESVAEFRAIRGNYSAEFGTGGGSQFNVITKGGTNNLHGSLYYFHRNDKLNARNYFSPVRDPFIGNDFGGSVGGPVYIPKVYNGRNKTFFFVLLGYIRENRQQRFTQVLPTDAYRSGNFAGLSRALYDPLSGLPFPGNVIPTNRIDANGAAYAKLYPSPNFSNSAGQNWTALQGRFDNTDEKNFRVDHNFSDNYRLMVRLTPEYRRSRYREGPGFDIFTREDQTPARNLTVNFNSTLKPTLISDFNFVRSHNRIKQFPTDVSPAKTGINTPQLFADTESTYPLTSLNLSKVPDRIPTISSIVGYAGLNNATPWSNYQTIYDFKEGLTWIRKAHTIKFGGAYSYEIKFEPTNTNVFGDFTFDGRSTGLNGGVGDAFADLLLGRAAAYSETNTVAFNDNRRNSFEAYVDDSWKVSRHLTLNLGVRYSFFPAAHEPDNRYRVFLSSAYQPSQAVQIDSAGRITRGIGNRFNGLVDPSPYWRNRKGNFAPRFSFAYDLFGNGKTAIRGGYGMFKSREILGAFILMSGNPPFSELLQVTNTPLSNPGGGSTRNYDLPITLGSNDVNQITPYSQQYNLNVQHQFGNNLVLEVGYSGSRGLHWMRTQDLNQPLPSAGVARGLAGFNADQNRPYKGWSVINNREQSYASNYNGLQMSLNRSFAKGFMFQTAYTWSRAIDNADYTGGIYGFYPNTQNASGERARASFDASHNFVTSYVWELPWGRAGKSLMAKVLGGWQYSGVVSIRTGLPISPELGRDIAGVGASTRQRPFATTTPFLDRANRSVSQWFNAAAYRPITDADYGTFSPVARNILSGPGWNQFDMSFAKNVRITEQVRCTLRADGFNVFNHTQFASVGTSFFTPATFGRVTAARDPRSFMVGARIQF